MGCASQHCLHVLYTAHWVARRYLRRPTLVRTMKCPPHKVMVRSLTYPANEESAVTFGGVVGLKLGPPGMWWRGEAGGTRGFVSVHPVAAARG